jgi:phosphate starvation-inducible PhoH-like protein
MTEPLTTTLEVMDGELLLRFSGPGGAHLQHLGVELGVSLGLRGNELLLVGPEQAVTRSQEIIAELLHVLEGRSLTELELCRAARTAVRNPRARLRELFEDVVLVTSHRKSISPKGIAQQLYTHSIRSHDIVFGVGPAGTGKTYLAMAMAVKALQEQRVRKIILTRPAVEAGEKLGFLPGDLAEKVNPYLRPLYDALYDMMDVERVRVLVEREIIEVAPLAFMRGRTLSGSFVILDEAQNTTRQQMKMFLTRIGFDSQAVITGDRTQVDLPRGAGSGLDDAVSLLEGIEGIDVVRFSDEDVVRHPLVQKIIRAYEGRA